MVLQNRPGSCWLHWASVLQSHGTIDQHNTALRQHENIAHTKFATPPHSTPVVSCDNVGMLIRAFTLILALSFVIGFALTGDVAAQIDFNRQIRPILSRHCIGCHGPDEGSREADLRLDTQAGATMDLGGYAAVAPGDPESSELIIRVTSDDDPMPPEGHGERLSDEEVELLRDWIRGGAAFQKHWSFVKPQSPDVPTSPDNQWSDHPVDQFIFRQANRHGLQPNPSANPTRLMRRIALDLTGLPPTPRMVDRFAANPSDEVLESVVDELLANPAYGEHWASMWLDLARYADTVGYAGDETRTIWPWRDWLIRSLNENKPFDEFTTELLAGDLLPNATSDQRLATAFHRNTLNNNEGGTNDEEFRTIAVKDRISTTINTWMGLTIRCAECHSHKYDPISQAEYYQFLDYFNQTADADRPNETPVIALRPASLQSQVETLDRQIDELQRKRERQPAVWQVTPPASMQSARGTRLESQADGSILATGPNPKQETWSVTISVPAGFHATALRIAMLPDEYHSGRVGRGQEGNFVLTQVRVAANDQPVKLAAAAADYAQSGFGPENLIREQIAADNETLGWAVQHNQQGFDRRRFAIVQFEQPLQVDHPASLKVDLVFNSKWHHRNAGRVQLAITKAPRPVEKFKSGQLEPLRRRIEQLVRQRNAPVQVPVLEELAAEKRRSTHIMQRGNFQNPGDLVTARVPAAFHAFPTDAPANRLGVARWLLHEDNPLTARVTVNRLWSRLFGKGLVVTEEDFGTQGQPPSHPQLLDWLAVDFRSSGWDVKRTLKLLVMSKTYRQSARVTAEKLETDPDNTWLARGPRVRLPAETIRDQALAVSGLLSHKMYGPPVYPPNPIKQVTNAFKGAEVWRTSEGEDRYRRSVYTFLKRSQPHPLFETFDTSTRDICSLRRINTNTPLQSFMTLNDEAFIEAAQALAIRMSEAEGLDNQIARGLELALLREADQQNVSPLRKLFQESLSQFEASPQQATEMLGRLPRTFRQISTPNWLH